MAQKPQIVDLTKSYLPGDPNAFVQNLVNTDREDGEEKSFPLMPYEGCNFLPTSYGYKSFFGTSAAAQIEALGSRAQHILLFQREDYTSRLIALCEDGIWTVDLNTADSVWVQQVTQAFDPDVFEEWTWCVIENVLYAYKQGTSYVYKTDTGNLTMPGGAIQLPSAYVTATIVEEAVSGDFNRGYTYNFDLRLRDAAGLLYGAYEALPSLEISAGSPAISVTFTYTGTVPAGLELLLYVEDVTGGNTYVITISGASPITISNLTPTLVDISTAYSISLSDTSTGDGTFDGTGWDIYLQFLGTGPEEHEISLLGTTVAATNTDIFINFIPTPRDLRIILQETGSSVVYYKDMTATTSVTIPNLTGFTEATMATLPGTLENEPDVIVPNEMVLTPFTPSFLNMAGQMGIFRAGLRLGFWDSANSVSWSSNLDLTDFTPSVENLAGNTIFGFVVGRIVLCKGHGEGFIIYSTKSVVGVIFSTTGNLLWDSKKIFDNTGISHSQAVATGKTDSEHYAFTNNGVYSIANYNSLQGRFENKAILTAIYDLLRESRDPVYLTVLQDRYLCFSVIDSRYITGEQSYSTGISDPFATVVDWYVPSDENSTGTEILLPEQFETIIQQEMTGKRRDKKTGTWIPLYNVTWDRLDTRYYSFWLAASGEDVTSLTSYFEADSFIATITDSLTAEELTTNLDSPISSGRRGTSVSMTAIRKFFGNFDVEIIDRAIRNVDTAIWNQRNEWDYFQRHQLLNMQALALKIHTSESYGSPFNKADRPTHPLPSDTNVTEIIGTVITGDGNNEWLFTRGPAADAAREMILRRTFNKAYQVTKRTRTYYSYEDYGTGAAYSTSDVNVVTSIYSSGSVVSGDHTTDTVITKTVNGSGETINWEISITYHRTDNDLRPGEYTQSISNTLYSDTAGTYITLADAYLPAAPDDGNLYRVSYSLTTNDSYWEPGGLPPALLMPSSSISGPLFYTQERIKTRVVTTYEYETITGEYGYSQVRAVVTHWDRIKSRGYENYSIEERVAASAMTPKVWADIYPTDQGDNRAFIDSYAGYRSVSYVDLVRGPYGRDTSGTPTPTISGYETEGITSQQFSFTVPGNSFLLQTGSISPAYNTFVGAFVFDLQLEKWGKYKGDHKVLFDSTPINAAISGSITYSDLGINAAMLDASGVVRLFDSFPEESWIRYGKLGYYRQGFTNILEVRTQMRVPSEYQVIVDSSMDGKLLDLDLGNTSWFSEALVGESYLDISARWHTIKIAGNFDLTGLEVRATLAGRR